MKPKKKRNPANLTLRNLRAENRRGENLLIVLGVLLDDMTTAFDNANLRFRVLRNERGEATTVIIIILMALGIIGGFGAVKYEDHLARQRMAEASKKLQVEQSIDWDKLPNEGEIR